MTPTNGQPPDADPRRDPRDPAAILQALAEAKPDGRATVFQGFAPDEGLLMILGDEAERLATVALPTALAACEALIEVSDALGSPRERARARRACSRALAYGGRLDDALHTSREAATIADDAAEAIEAARARLASLHPLCELGRIEEAVAEGSAARQALLLAGEPALAARADINLANIEKNRGAPLRALAHLDAARAALADDRTLVAHIDNARGEALLLLDRFAESEAAFLAARAEFAAGAAFAEAVVEGNLADLCARQGRLQEALAHFESARRRLERDAAEGHVARTLVEQAEALEASGLLDDALAGYDEALPRLTRVGLAFETGRARLGRGRVLLRLRRAAEATPDLENAAAIFDELGHGSARARVDLIRGEQAARTGDPDSARTLFEGALAVLEDQPSASATARFHLANLAIDAGDIDQADQLLRDAIASVAALGIPTLMADLLHAQGRARRLRGDVTAAIDSYREALQLVEQVRGSFSADRLRAAFLGERVALYEDLVNALLERGGPDVAAEAFAVVERAKSRSLLELIRGAVESFASGLTESDDPEIRALAAEAARLQAELNALYTRLGGEGSQDQRLVTDVAWQERVRSRERELTRIEHRLAATERGAMVLATPVDVEAVQSALPAATALVEYFVADRELMAWIVERDAVRLVRGLSDHAAVIDRVTRLRFQIGKALRPNALEGARAARLLEDARCELMALHEILAAPILAAMARTIDDVQRLIVVPHGPLHLVPFHALRSGSSASPATDLIDRFEIAVCPSAGVFVHAARRPRSTGSRGAAVVGVGDAAAPLIPAEARAVAERLHTERVFIGAEATVDRVAAAIPDARIVHFACHGRFSATAPLSSGLLLADRWMTVRDITRLRLQADLVALSGCETGCNLVSGGDELLGLLRGFLAAGAGSVLASLWTTSDSSTAALMDCFYAGLLGAGPGSRLRPGEALRAAQIAIRKERPHPVLWAPFIITGAS